MRRRSDLNIEGAATTEGIAIANVAAPEIANANVPIERAFIESHLLRSLRFVREESSRP
jgi:hypothetical protein